MEDLKKIESLPQGSMSRENGAQFNYNLSAAAVTGEIEDAYVDIITDFKSAFEWEQDENEYVKGLLREEKETAETITDDVITVYLPSLETLKATFESSNRDYQDRIEMVDNMLEDEN